MYAYSEASRHKISRKLDPTKGPSYLSGEMSQLWCATQIWKAGNPALAAPNTLAGKLMVHEH